MTSPATDGGWQRCCPVEREYAAAVARFDRVPDDLRDVAWMIEELRMSTFAQPLGVDGSASAKRIRREIARSVAGAGRLTDGYDWAALARRKLSATRPAYALVMRGRPLRWANTSGPIS